MEAASLALKIATDAVVLFCARYGDRHRARCNVLGEAMDFVIYNGYVIRGHARPLVDGMFEATGAVEQDGKVIESSDPLGYYPSFERTF